MTVSPWLVPITGLRRTPGARRGAVRSGPLGELQVAGSRVASDAEVEVEATLDVVDGGIEVIGEVRAPWSGECRRCCRPVTGELRSDVREIYRPAVDGEVDEETYSLGTDHLDLAPLARDTILLELPLAPLCRPDCAGLCPTCGADLSESACGCDTVVVDPRWAALDQLRPLGSEGGPASGAATS